MVVVLAVAMATPVLAVNTEVIVGQSQRETDFLTDMRSSDVEKIASSDSPFPDDKKDVDALVDAVLYEVEKGSSPQNIVDHTSKQITTPEVQVLVEEPAKEEKITAMSKIPMDNIAAFALIITFLIAFTLIFEHSKETIVESIKGTENEPIVNSIFAELTVLGFLALTCFLLNKFGLDHISYMVFGHAEADDKTKLSEMLEVVHMVLFMVMSIFIFEALGMLWVAGQESDRWGAIEDNHINITQRKILMKLWKSLATEEELLQWSFKEDGIEATANDDLPRNSPGPWELFFNFTERSQQYYDTKEKVEFTLMRQEFLHDEKDSGYDLDRTFSFKHYLVNIMGDRLGRVVELPVNQWLALEVTAMTFLALNALMQGSWLFLMCCWFAWSWFILLCAHMFLRYLKNIKALLVHQCNGFSILESSDMERFYASKYNIPFTPHGTPQTMPTPTPSQEIDDKTEATKPETTEPSTDDLDKSTEPSVDKSTQPTGDGTLPTEGLPDGSGNGAGEAEDSPDSPPQETTPLYIRPKKRRGVVSAEGRTWIGTVPRYHEMKELDKAPTCCCCLPVPFRGVDHKAEADVGKRRFYNLFTYGKDEVAFHLFVIRFFFLGTAVYMSVFYLHIVPAYIVPSYEIPQAIFLAIAGTLPGLLVYFWYIYDIIDTSILVTSVEEFRSRRIVEEVKRYQKESRSVMLLRIVCALSDKTETKTPQDPLTEQEVMTMANALQAAKHLEQHVQQYSDYLHKLTEADASLRLGQLSKCFDKVDQDEPKGYLSAKDVGKVLGKFGLWKTDGEGEAISENNLQECIDIGHVEQNPDSKGLVSKAAFLAFMVKTQDEAEHKYDSETIARWIFNQWDSEQAADGESSRSLDIGEFQNGLLKFGQSFTADEVSAIISELDLNGDGEFNEEELSRWIELHSRSDGQNVKVGLFGFGFLGF